MCALYTLFVRGGRVFCLSENSASGKAINACKLVQCNKPYGIQGSMPTEGMCAVVVIYFILVFYMYSVFRVIYHRTQHPSPMPEIMATKNLCHCCQPYIHEKWFAAFSGQAYMTFYNNMSLQMRLCIYLSP